jgi:diguanylate cyclase (GGDEF)-like protein
MRSVTLGFRARLLLGAVLPALLMVSLLELVFLGRYQTELEHSFHVRGQAIARQLGPAAEYALFTGSRETLQVLADATRASDPRILSVSLLGRGGEVLAHAGSAAAPTLVLTPEMQVHDGPDRTTVIAPIQQTMLPVDDGLHGWKTAGAQGLALVGYVVVEISRSELAARQRETVQVTLAIMLSGLLLATWLSLKIAAEVTRPLECISETVEKIGRGHLSARVSHDPAGVLTLLETGINDMAEKMAAAQHDLQHRIDAATDALRQQKEAAESLARTDSLTGLANRRAFDEVAELEIQRAVRYGTPLALVIADLDHFKAINDRYGHHVGDEVLKGFARILTTSVRGIDLVGRWGGEEFVVLMPGTGIEEAMQAAERMRLAVAGAPTRVDGKTFGYTASFGVAELLPDVPTMDALLSRTDAALYRAKHQGRNRVEAG